MEDCIEVLHCFIPENIFKRKDDKEGGSTKQNNIMRNKMEKQGKYAARN
jgi:hypothetical protein